MDVCNKKYDFSKISMKIIMPAGDARTKAQEAFEAALKHDFESARELMDEADEYIKTAHRAQTEIMQQLASDEYNGNDCVVLPMLFIHAQDTIMTIMSEVNTTKQNIQILKRMEEIVWKK